jgi:hypothetical protein
MVASPTRLSPLGAQLSRIDAGAQPRIRAHHNGASTAISTRRARHSPITNRVRVGDAMDVPECADVIPEPISVRRCRELLGDEADALNDDEVIDVARHAEAMAHILIDLALQDRRIH